MTFEEWWKNHDYSEHNKEECRDAYNAGMEEDFNKATREINDRDAIINFLKKELIKKTYCRQVMKRQYRELRQKYDAKKGCVDIAEIMPYTQSLVIPLLKEHLEKQNQIFVTGKDRKICEEANFQINMTLAVLEKLVGGKEVKQENV